MPDGDQPNQAIQIDWRSTARINEIVLGKRGFTADTALRLAKVFGTSVQFWVELQDEYELRETCSAIKAQLERKMPIAA